MDWGFALAGAFVGLLVGITGVGGGSLMAPILILLLGVPPAVAIGTDLWFASITKAVGGFVHHRFGSTDWKIVGWLALGSLPATAATLVWLGATHGGRLESATMLTLLGSALLVVAVIMMIKPLLHKPLIQLRARLGPQLRHRQALATCVAGLGVGVMVTLTSIGAGAVVAVLLLLIYPLRLNAKKIVGTDIVHAVPLTFVAALGHSWLGNVDIRMLASLLVGSVPGIIAGSLLAGKFSEQLVRYALAAMLVVSAFKMIVG